MLRFLVRVARAIWDVEMDVANKTSLSSKGYPSDVLPTKKSDSISFPSFLLVYEQL